MKIKAYKVEYRSTDSVTVEAHETLDEAVAAAAGKIEQTRPLTAYEKLVLGEARDEKVGRVWLRVGSATSVSVDRSLAGVPEMAERFGVNRSAIYYWMKRDGFPEPVADLRSGRLWSLAAVEAWRSQREPENRPGPKPR